MDANAAMAVMVAVCAMNLCAVQQTTAQQTQGTSAPSSTIHVDTDVLLLPVVVRDAQGHAIGDLKKEDFTVFDQGKPRAISRITLEKSSATADSANPGSQRSSTLMQVPPDTATVQVPVAARRFVVFLFDDRHLSVTDFEHSKNAAIRILDKPLPTSDWVTIVTTSGVGSGITKDHAKLQSAIKSLKAQQRPHQDEHQCPYIDHYSADQIINQNSPIALGTAVLDTVVCAHVAANVAEAMAMGAAHQSLEAGDEDTRVSLEFVRNVVQTMSALRGQRTLILVSPGFLAVSDKARNLESQILDSAARASVTISTLDARGLFTTNLGAHLSPTEAPLSTLVQHQQEFADAT